jgi:hypothetical protein
VSKHRADGDPSPRRDPHPELSAPIVDLGLEGDIARAEQAVKDRDARVRRRARHIVGIARSERGTLITRAAVVGGMGLAAGAGYAGYKAWVRRRPSQAERPDQPTPPRAHQPFGLAGLAALAQTALRWGVKLHREQGAVGSVFGELRKAFWPSPAEPARAPDPIGKGGGVR